MSVCTGCQTENRTEAKFCKGCGKPLAAPVPAPDVRVCPICQKSVSIQAKFCRGCGHKLDAPALAPAPTLVSVPPAVSVPQSGPRLRLRLRYDNHELTLDAAYPAATLGRESTCNLVIRDPRASRLHCRIELRHDMFYLADQSTNGTYLTIEGETEFALQQAELPLRGRGRISFGRTLPGEQSKQVEFDISRTSV